MPNAGWVGVTAMISMVMKSSMAFSAPVCVYRSRFPAPRNLRFAPCFRAQPSGSRRHLAGDRGRASILPSMLLGVEASLGIVGISALGALKLFTTNIAPKRVRVVTDIDDTVKSSGNKRLLGIPLGGIDSQCEFEGAELCFVSMRQHEACLLRGSVLSVFYIFVVKSCRWLTLAARPVRLLCSAAKPFQVPYCIYILL